MGAHDAGHDALHGADDLRRDHDGVDAVFGAGTVAFLAADRDVDAVAGGGHGRGTADDGPGGEVRRHVLGEHGIHVGIFQGAVRDHLLRAAVRRVFLGGLEHKLDLAGEAVAHVEEDMRRAQQHGCVGVVAAGVHHARGLRREGQARLFPDRQGVDVRPQADAFGFAGCGRGCGRGRRRGALDHGGDAVSADALLRIQAHVAEPRRDIRRRLLFFMAQLRMRMHVLPVFQHLSGVLLHQRSDTFVSHFIYAPFLKQKLN